MSVIDFAYKACHVCLLILGGVKLIETYIEFYKDYKNKQ